MTEFTIYMHPQAWKRAGRHTKIKDGKTTSWTYTPPKMQEYKHVIREKALEMFDEPMSGPVALQLKFYIPRPQRLIWKTKPMPVTMCSRRPDLDNYIKLIQDALNGVAYHDDSQVAYIRAAKMYHAGSKEYGDPRPRIEISIGECE